MGNQSAHDNDWIWGISMKIPQSYKSVQILTPKKLLWIGEKKEAKSLMVWAEALRFQLRVETLHHCLSLVGSSSLC